MQGLMHMLKRLVHRATRRSADERYLALSIDAQDFERRLQALERSRV